MRFIVERLDDVLRRADVVGVAHDVVPALRVYEHVHAGDARTHLVDVVDGEPAVHRAVPAPQDHFRVVQLLRCQPAAGLVRVE
jgi:hypothetical protein